MHTKKGITLSVILCLCAIAAGISVIKFAASRSEPQYAGRTLTEWVMGKPTYAASNAIYHMGPAAVPYVVSWVSYEESAMMEKLRDWFDIQSPKLHRANQAYYALNALGEHGRAAIPAFNDILHSNRAERRRVGVMFLAQLGDVALPTLAAALTNEYRDVRHHAASEIAERRAYVPAAIPNLVAMMNDTNDTLGSLSAIEALSHMDYPPEVPICLLNQHLASSNRSQFYLAASAARRFGTNAQPLIPHLEAAFSDPEYCVRFQATQAVVIIRQKLANAGIPADYTD